MTIGETLRALREQQGVARDALARKLGKDRSVIARAESPNANPTWSTVTDHLEALGCNVWDLVATMDPANVPQGARSADSLSDDAAKVFALRKVLTQSSRQFAAQLRRIEAELRGVVADGTEDDE